MIINRTLRLTSDQYFPEETNKTQIVLHHTVGGSARSTFNWWQQTPDRVATSYLIERDGTIYEVFDPLYWAHHLGLKVSRNVVYNKASIGIELASEGALVRGSSDNWLYAFDGAKKLYHLFDDKEKFVDFGGIWRGYQYFDAYDPAQYASLVELTRHLMVQFDIEEKMSMTSEFDTKYYEFKGIITHSNVRTDKTDLHPMFDWDGFMKDIAQF